MRDDSCTSIETSSMTQQSILCVHVYACAYTCLGHVLRLVLAVRSVTAVLYRL